MLLTLKIFHSSTDNRDQTSGHLRDRTSTFLSFRITAMSESSAPQQLSFFTWFISLTRVRATIMSSDNLTILFLSAPASGTWAGETEEKW